MQHADGPTKAHSPPHSFLAFRFLGRLARARRALDSFANESSAFLFSFLLSGVLFIFFASSFLTRYVLSLDPLIPLNKKIYVTVSEELVTAGSRHLTRLQTRKATHIRPGPPASPRVDLIRDSVRISDAFDGLASFDGNITFCPTLLLRSLLNLS